MGSIGAGFGEWAKVSLRRSRVRQVSVRVMCQILREDVCVSVPLGIACGVAVSGCRWPRQPRLPRDPPCAKEYEVRIDCKRAAWPGGVRFPGVEVFG